MLTSQPYADGLHAVEILCVLGDARGAKAAARELTERLEEIQGENDTPRWLPNRCAAFLAGDIDEATFKRDTEGDTMSSLMFHFYSAMKMLSIGEREKAINHFKKCDESSQVAMWSFLWARAFRRLLCDDADQPAS